MKYDDGSFHTGTAASEAHAAAHIGLYFRWCLLSGLVAPEHTGEPELQRQLKKVEEGRMTGAAYLWENTSGKLADVDLTEEGNRFSRWFYNRHYCRELHTIIGKADHQYTETDVDFAAVKAWLDQALSQWRAQPPKKPWWRVWT